MPQPPFTVLLVCTGNICRSALAERLGRGYLDETLGADAAQIRVTSAGTRAVVGSAMHPDSALVLRGFGGDPDGFTARQLTDAMVMDADLVVTMTRGHRRDVLSRPRPARRRRHRTARTIPGRTGAGPREGDGHRTLPPGRRCR